MFSFFCNKNCLLYKRLMYSTRNIEQRLTVHICQHRTRTSTFLMEKKEIIIIMIKKQSKIMYKQKIIKYIYCRRSSSQLLYNNCFTFLYETDTVFQLCPHTNASSFGCCFFLFIIIIIIIYIFLLSLCNCFVVCNPLRFTDDIQICTTNNFTLYHIL